MDLQEKAKELDCTKEAKEGLFKVENGVKGTDAWLDFRDGEMTYYVYGDNGLISNPSKPSEIGRLFKMKRGKGNSKLGEFA